MKKQLSIFVGLFFTLTMVMHIDGWIDHPYEQFINVSMGGYGLGLAHPFIFTLLAYLLFIFISFIGRFIKKIFSK